MTEDRPPEAAQRFFTDLIAFRESVHDEHTLALTNLQLSAKHRHGLHHQLALLIKELAEMQVRLGTSNWETTRSPDRLTFRRGGWRSTRSPCLAAPSVFKAAPASLACRFTIPIGLPDRSRTYVLDLRRVALIH